MSAAARIPYDPALGMVEYARRHEALLKSILFDYVHRKAVVNELMQDLYVSLLERLNEPVPRCPLSYLVQMARFAGVDYYRKRDTQSLDFVGNLDAHEQEGEHLDPDRVHGGIDDFDELLKAMQRLPPCQRQVVVLKKVYGYTQDQIAQRLGVSVNTIEQHMCRALRTLADRLGRPLAGMKGTR